MYTRFLFESILEGSGRREKEGASRMFALTYLTVGTVRIVAAGAHGTGVAVVAVGLLLLVGEGA